MKKILIIRNDKLGDFMLAFPSFDLIKRNLPDFKIHALVPSYTCAMAESCKSIDKIINDPGKDSGWLENISLLKQLKQENYDAVITLYSTTRIGLITKLAGIPYRLAPATKLAQVFYNHKLTQHRSRSEKPEYVYNMELIYLFLKQYNIETIEEPSTPYLKYSNEKVSLLRKAFLQQHNIPENHKLIFVHAGCGGSANNMSPQQFSTLAENLKSQSGHTIVITAGPGEIDTAKEVSRKLADTPHIIFDSKEGIVNFSMHIQFADLFIAGSTGPLHIAGALDTPTVGFYTRRRSATSLRWQTLNSLSNQLSFSPPREAEEEDMSSIDLDMAAKKINQTFLLDN